MNALDRRSDAGAPLFGEAAVERKSASHGEAGYARAERDFYPTEPWVTAALCAAVEFGLQPVLFHSATFSASYVTHKWLPYDTLGDFIAVSAVGISPSVLVSSPAKGYKTVADLVAALTAPMANRGRVVELEGAKVTA